MKTRFSYMITYLSLGLMLFLSLSCATKPKTTGLGEPKSELFYSTKDLMDRAVSERADEFAPQTYGKAQEHYRAAEKDFEKGKSEAKIQKHLDKSAKFAQQSIDLAKSMNSDFPKLVDFRDKAIAAGAEKMGLKNFDQGQKYFLRTASSLADNDMEEARENAEQALKHFQTAELEGIQESMVGQLNKHLQELEGKGAKEWSPETFQTAIKYRDAAMETLEKDRYNNQPEAQKLVKEGEYFFRKADYLTEKIKEAKGDKANWEKVFLQREEDLNKIASPLNLEPSFDKGFEEPLSEIDQAILELKEREQSLNRQLAMAEQSLAQARQQARQSEQARQQVTSELQLTESTLRERKMMEERLNRVQKLFPFPEQAKVSLDPKNNITIILTGLSFETGKSTLTEESYPLLANLNEAARIFSDRKIRITGHTDSTGSNEFNRRLSLERAKSVSNYMASQLGVSQMRMMTSGLGESQPIAPNTTPDGRRLNRRIEVTLLSP